MIYERDGERPKQGTLKVSFDPPQIDEEDREAVNEQCLVFYNMNLTEAVIEAF